MLHHISDALSAGRGVLPAAIEHARERRVFLWDDSDQVYVSDDLRRDVAYQAAVRDAWGRLWRPAPHRAVQLELVA